MISIPEFRLEIVEEAESTNAALLARPSPVHGMALLAKKQTSGHGRRGRGWEFLDGNLALSVALEPKGADQALIARLPFVAGVALFDTVHSFLPQTADLALKWPNDLMLAKKKLAGLLVEVRQSGSEVKVVLGIGMNLRKAPDLADAVSLLEATGISVSPEEFAEAFLWIFGRMEHLLGDFPALRDAWETRSAHKDGEIFYGDRDKPSSMRKAKVLGLLDAGTLLVRDLESGKVQELLSEDTSLRL